MSVCGQAPPEDDSGSEEVTATAAAVRDIYKQKPTSKVVRVLTVLAYLLSVSLAAILLSVYYVCVWKSPDLPPANHSEPETGARTSHAHYHSADPGARPQLYNYTGGSDSAVEALDTTESPEINATSEGYNSSSTPYSEYQTPEDYTDDPVLANDTDSVT